MKNRFKNWWNRPITRGDYTKWCLGSLAVSALYGTGVYIYYKHQLKKLYEPDLGEDTEEEDNYSENY